VDVGAVLGPLFGGLPLDAQGVCLPVERVELVEGRFRRLSELDARRIRLEGVVERRSELYALITVEGETFEVRDGQRFATSLRLIDSQLALEIVDEETGRISGAEPATVVLHHEDRWCPVRSVGVVLDPRDGSVLAMASAPTFDPNSFVRGLPVDEWQELLTVNAFTNFAIQGVYAPASTMKSVAYMLAMEEGVYPLDRPAGDRTVGSAEEERPLVPLESDTDEYECRGSLRFEFNDGTEQVYNDWKRTGHGPLDLHGALEASCDLYFWEIALRIWNERDEDGGIHNENLWQEWARFFGFDAATGIDLPFEKEGLIPDRRWYREEQRAGSPRVRSDGPWVGGDLMNAVIGEGSVLATPLQLANAYAAMANGGTLWTPRVLDRVVDQDGRVLDDNPPQALARIPLDVDTVQAFRRDLQSVINGSRGTARDTFSRFGENVEIVGGKTGTGEVIKASEDAFEVDNAWFVGLAPISAPRYVVAVVVERGGSGGGIAAPVARQVLQFLINGPDGVTPIEKAARAD
jgi:penicillin-binding protein 2